MQYLFTGIDTHLDFGFGITGESYYYSAEYLLENKENLKADSQVEMPINFLYRHSIELFLKSLIIIFHKKLQLPYGTESYESLTPKILTGGVWKNLYTCHWIDELYNYWLNDILLKHNAKLKEIAPKGDWQECKEITDFFPLIKDYDRDSSFFRYPVTKNTSLDSKKFTFQRLDAEKIQKIFSENSDDTQNKNGSKLITLLKNDNDEIVDAFEKNTNILVDISQALKEVSYYFNCIHIMTRVTLCDGN